MLRFFRRYRAVLVPLAAAAAIAVAALPVLGPWRAFLAAAGAASLLFLPVLLRPRGRPARPARAPLSMAELGLEPGPMPMPAPIPAETERAAAEPALLEPGIDEALRQTLAELRRLARAA